MAELAVYEYHGPGERRTAEFLAEHLPASWVILAGRSLPTVRQDDVDLIILGENLVFAVEEKSWGPRVDVRRAGWLVKGDLRQSPVGRITHLSRVLAGILTDRVSGYRGAAARDHLVRPLVVLSHDRLELVVTDDPGELSIVTDLASSIERLRELDSAKRTGLPMVRDDVAEFLGGFASRNAIPEVLHGYADLEEIAGVGRARQFEAKNDLGRPVVLRCYPLDGWGHDFDVLHFVRREREATEAIAHANRAWRSEPIFVDDVRRWVVVPVLREPSISLKRARAIGALEVWAKDALTAGAVAIVRDAFDALSQVHQQQLVHRGIAPERVVLAKSQRVMFKDFYLAKALGEETIAPAIEDAVDVSTPWRAPECAQFIGAASFASDVYSLALTMCSWLQPLSSRDDLGTWISKADDPVFHVLRRCLDADPTTRPSAADVSSELAEPDVSIPSPTDAVSPGPAAPIDYTVGALIADRFRIEKKLGSGGFARSWLATDTRADRKRVLKEFHDSRATRAAAAEFQAADDLRSEYCARVYDLLHDPAPTLVMEYVEGDSLRDLAETGRADAETYRGIALDALTGLAHMHANQRLHRDISPGNIIVTPSGSAKLIDFGLSTDALDAQSVVGTPPFMPPEILSGGQWSPASDLYSLGVSLLRCMLNRLPYEGDPRHGTDDRSKVRMLSVEEEEMWGPDGAAVLRHLFGLVEADPAGRPQSASTFAAELALVKGRTSTEGEPRVNATVDSLRRLYRGSSLGNAGNRGLDDPFAQETYLPTKLDTLLAPAIIGGELDVVLLTGNPGDGKTSFLVALRNQLLRAGARTLEDNVGGWRLQLADRTYAAVYDASESRDGMSADDLVETALEGAPGGPHTALLAVNDGRLMEFFVERSDEYPEVYEAVETYRLGREGTGGRVALIDLKTRSLARLSSSDDGLAGRILDAMTDEPRWRVCVGCSSRSACPMLTNRNMLLRDGKSAVLELVHTSHLRRRRRATFRDVRSAFGWLITGDRSCNDVHDAVGEGLDLRNSTDVLAFDLAFTETSQDYLIREWRDLDPANLPAPALDRHRDSMRSDHSTLRATQGGKRQTYFLGVEGEHARELKAYRYLDVVVGALSGDQEARAVLPKVLLGLSRLLGAPGYEGDRLAILEGGAEGWSVLREIEASEFDLTRHVSGSEFVETQADYLQLNHHAARLNLTLDAAELVFRAADGELVNDAASDAVKLELISFSDQLKRAPGRALHVVDPAGRLTTVSTQGSRIEAHS